MSCCRHRTACSRGPICKGAAGQVSNAGHAPRALGDSHTSVPWAFHVKPIRRWQFCLFLGRGSQHSFNSQGAHGSQGSRAAAQTHGRPRCLSPVPGREPGQPVAQTGQGKLSEEQDSEMLPRPALPLFLSPVQPGHTPQAPAGPRPLSHPPSTPASVPPHIWLRAHRSCCLRAIC